MYKRTPLKIIFFSILIIGVAAGFGGGFIFGKTLAPKNGTVDLSKLERFFSKRPSFDLINEGIEIIDEKYVGSGDFEIEELIYGAMEGMLESLDDAYTVFLRPKDSKVFEENVDGAFEGIGAEIGMREGALTVIAPLKDSPAEHSGLKAGDKILFVDDKETQEFSLDEAVQIIRGPKRTKVVLTVSRDGEEKDLKISIIRDTIKIPNIKWEDKGDGIAYIALYHFTEKASGDFRDTVSEILRSDAEKIILDLRNNPGGFLEVAVDIAGWFLGADMLVVAEDRGGREEDKTREVHGTGAQVYISHGSGALGEMPVVILVNGGSASASEILAGALRDHLGVQLIGETTFGKGSVQELVKLSDDSSIKITVAKWLTPNGTSIQDNGLEPDIFVEMTQEIFNEKGDVQLKKAIEVLREL